MTTECSVCEEELEFETRAWHPNDPRTVEAAQAVLDDHEMKVHWV